MEALLVDGLAKLEVEDEASSPQRKPHQTEVDEKIRAIYERKLEQ